MIRITTDREVINAIKEVEELRKVLTILKNDVAYLEGVPELCLDYALGSEECRHLNISRGSYISAILSLNNTKQKYKI
jgi:hypothetical protein